MVDGSGRSGPSNWTGAHSMPRPRGAAVSTPGDNVETAVAAALALHLDTVDGEQTANLHDASKF